MGDNAHTADLLAVHELLSAMKSTLSALGKTFESLGEQTTKVAELGPAMEATHQLALIRDQIDAQYAHQDARMEKFKKLLRDELKEKIAQKFSLRVHALIQEKVEERVEEKVHEQLLNQIPSNLRQDITHHKQQILQVNLTLHNSEARRHNSLLTLSTSDFREPLQPLLRPYPGQCLSPIPSIGLTPPISQTQTPMLSRNISSTSADAATTSSHSTVIEPPTPSPLFPRNIADLFEMSPEQTRKLIEDYDLVRDNANSPDAFPANPTSPESLTDMQGMHTNRFMAYIGVPYQIVPGSASSTSPGPLLTRVYK